MRVSSPVAWADPAVLAVGGDSALLLEAVEDLLEIGEVIRDWDMPVCISGDAAAALEEDGYFPLPAKLQGLFSQAGIDHISGHDVAKLVYALLNRAETVEVVLEVEDMLIEERRYDPIPSKSEGQPALDALWLRTLDLLAMGLAHDRLLSRHILTSRGRRQYGELHVGGRLEIVEMRPLADGGENPKTYCPCSYDQSLALYPGSRKLLLGIEPEAVLAASIGPNDVASAIALMALQMACEGGDDPKLSDLRRFTVGSQLRPSLLANGVLGDNSLAGKFLRSCAEVILGTKPGKTHEIRTSKGGSSDPVKMAGATAQRRDLDREYHLHYWAPTSHGFEFAAVVRHKELAIPALERP